MLNANSENKRDRILQTDMPRASLKEAVVLAVALRDNFAGKNARPIDLAKAVDWSPSSSGWRVLTGAAIAYGLTEGAYNATYISLTTLGQQIVKPTMEGLDKQGMMVALMRPSITRSFYEKYNGAKFPKDDIAKNVLNQLGVPQERTDEALKIVIDNAKLVGILTDAGGSQYIQLHPISSIPVEGSPAPTMMAQDHTFSPPAQSSQLSQASTGGQSSVFQDSGAGWSILVKSQKTISSDAKKKLIEVAELLDEVNST